MTDSKQTSDYEAEIKRLKDALEQTRSMLLEVYGIFGGGHRVNDIFDHINQTLKPDGRRTKPKPTQP
jgi:hypothetical protein